MLPGAICEVYDFRECHHLKLQNMDNRYQSQSQQHVVTLKSLVFSDDVASLPKINNVIILG